LKKGSQIALVAPSALPFNHCPSSREGVKLSEALIETLIKKIDANGLRAQFYGSLSPQSSYHNYYSNATEQRAQALSEAIENPDCEAILILRGGFGALDILRQWETIGEDPFKKANKPKIIIGFSDATYLLHKAALNGWPSLHGPMGISLRDSTPSLSQLIALLKGETPQLIYEWEVPAPFQKSTPSCLEGVIMGGNLSVIQRQLGTSSSFCGAGKFVFIEDTEKDPKRQLDLFLHLIRSGALGTPQKPALALLLGYTPLSPLPHQSFESLMAETFEVYKKCLKSYGFEMPLLYNPDFGHGKINYFLPFGALSKIDFSLGKHATIKISL
jgi:muramoyltetrapeptide carboxypeptidase